MGGRKEEEEGNIVSTWRANARRVESNQSTQDYATHHILTPQVSVRGGDAAASGPYPALKLTFKEEGGSSTKEIVASPYRPPNPGPYPQDQPQRNAVRFTPVQVRGGTGLSTRNMPEHASLPPPPLLLRCISLIDRPTPFNDE